ncbi:MAG: enoyl-CoA hydratase/isomerase family protein [Planctomycetes bacterium]|nr:enoyl-CoA hydratase/isomerase family protein [Planctomycetota bacterium]
MTQTAEKPATQVELLRAGAVATFQFSSPTGVNVFSSGVISSLGVLLERIHNDPSVRFVVLRGVGKTFAAGADIAQMAGFSEDDGEIFAKTGHHVFAALAALPQVSIAAINGHALGGGCEISLACDFRIAVSTAKLGQPESRLGLVPGWGGTQRLAKIVGLAHAKRLMFSGEGVTAEEALRIGLVDEVVPAPADLDAALARWVERLRAGSPAAIRRIKHALAHNDEVKQFAMCFSCSDAREGMAAFLEKRPPSWTNG